jgi:hypothetical protein
VTQAAEEWPEQALRRRVWVDRDEALTRVHEKGLRELIRAATNDRAFSET